MIVMLLAVEQIKVLIASIQFCLANKGALVDRLDWDEETVEEARRTLLELKRLLQESQTRMTHPVEAYEPPER